MVESIRATFKRKFIAGLFVSVPVIITILVIGWFFKTIDGLLGQFYDELLGRHIAGLGFISAVVLIFIVGIVSTNVFGKKILAFVERIFLNIPVFKGIYAAIKQLVDAFSPESKSSFKKFVIVEYPRPGTYVFGFLTKECCLRPAKDAETCLKAIYIPTNNLYLGEIVLFKENEVFNTDLTIEEGIKIILSGGIATPDYLKESSG
ncbi:MAG: DUF502 domain-containing protein [Nitrospirae bacterium]|nr:DUF502 domain-containing protein [Nitrospirota bacterium]